MAISGSTRYLSSNEAILKFIANHYSESLDVELYAGIAELPHFNPDLDDESIPLSVQGLRKRIEEADGVLICTPEYIFSLPGALKNAIEWTVSTTVFSDKPTALIVASGLGEKAYESLHLIMTTVGAKIGKQASLLIQGARSKFNSQGKIADESVLRGIDNLMHSFMETVDDTPAEFPTKG